MAFKKAALVFQGTRWRKGCRRTYLDHQISSSGHRHACFPLVRTESHGHTELQGRLGNVVFILGSAVASKHRKLPNMASYVLLGWILGTVYRE